MSNLNTNKLPPIEKELVLKLGYRIASLRAKRKMSRIELAKLADLHHQYLYDVEVGKRNVTIYVLFKIANAFKMQLKEFLDIEL